MGWSVNRRNHPLTRTRARVRACMRARLRAHTHTHLCPNSSAMGWTYAERRFDSTLLNVEGGKQLEYKVAALIEFNSTRKRMSMVVQMPDTGKYKLMIKGADTFIAALAGVQGFDSVGGKAKLDKQLDNFASEGLRTLVLCTNQLQDF